MAPSFSLFPCSRRPESSPSPFLSHSTSSHPPNDLPPSPSPSVCLSVYFCFSEYMTIIHISFLSIYNSFHFLHLRSFSLLKSHFLLSLLLYLSPFALSLCTSIFCNSRFLFLAGKWTPTAYEGSKAELSASAWTPCECPSHPLFSLRSQFNFLHLLASQVLIVFALILFYPFPLL